MDLLITDGDKLYTVIEFKNIQIAFLGLGGEGNTERMEQLQAMKLDKVLGLKFNGDKYRTGTIRNWIDGRSNSPHSGKVRTQLRSYISARRARRHCGLGRSSIEHSGGLELIEKCIKKGLADPNPGVRESMRGTFWTFFGLWPDRATECVQSFISIFLSLLYTSLCQFDFRS